MPALRLAVPLTALVCAIAVAAPAAAATAPAATTDPARDVQPTTATLAGTVNPHGAETSYVFDYGTTTAYGQRTPAASAGSGTSGVPVSTPVGALRPRTTYHFRLVAFSPNGTTQGADRSFRTPRTPVTISIVPSPDPVPFGSSTTISGAVAAAPAGVQVVLESKPFPFTTSFTQVGNPQVTGTGGTYSFPVVGLAATTQYRVRTTSTPRATSPIATVAVAVRVSVATRVRRLARGAYVRLSGSVAPAHDGAQLAIQKLSHGRWVNVLGTIVHHATPASSRYSVRVRTRHSGTYRVFVRVADGDHVSGISRSVAVRLSRR